MKAVIIEDETAAAVNLQSILHRVAPAVEITAVLEGVEESVEWFGTHPQPDLVLMDIHLADGEAFRIFERVSLTAPVIFTTAYDRYALEAFKVDSIDYLLKPIKEEEVRRALEKLRRLSGLERSRYSERVERLAERANERQQVFLVRVRDKFIPLQRERIAYCYTSDERVTACTLDGEKYPLDKPLETLQTLLPASDFFRANRQYKSDDEIDCRHSVSGTDAVSYGRRGLLSDGRKEMPLRRSCGRTGSSEGNDSDEAQGRRRTS